MSSIASPLSGSDDDLVFDFSFDLNVEDKMKKIKENISGIDRLWRAVKKQYCNNDISPTAFSLREWFNDSGELTRRESELSLYEMINKNNESLQSEADSFMCFMINEGPFDVRSDLPVLLCLNSFISSAAYSNVVSLFIENISKTSPQKSIHTKAYHWDINYVNQEDCLEIRSLLAHYSVAYVNNMLGLNREKVKERKREEKIHRKSGA